MQCLSHNVSQPATCAVSDFLLWTLLRPVSGILFVLLSCSSRVLRARLDELYVTVVTIVTQPRLLVTTQISVSVQVGCGEKFARDECSTQRAIGCSIIAKVG